MSCNIPDKQYVIYSGQCVLSPFKVPGLSESYLIADISKPLIAADGHKDMEHMEGMEGMDKDHDKKECSYQIAVFEDQECMMH